MKKRIRNLTSLFFGLTVLFGLLICPQLQSENTSDSHLTLSSLFTIGLASGESGGGGCDGISCYKLRCSSGNVLVACTYQTTTEGSCDYYQQCQ